MANWRTSSDGPYIAPDGAHYFRPLTLEVEIGTGGVEVQRLQPDGTTWVVIETEGTISASGIYRIERANSPTIRIVATGNAAFSVRGH